MSFLIKLREIDRRLQMKWGKKRQNVLFVEDDEKYNWSSEQSGLSRRLIRLSLLFLGAAVLFSALS